MARILFTVCGVGLGHATRSSQLIEGLIKEHKVFVVSSGEAHDYLQKKFHYNEKINWFNLVY
ncbi:teichoic acid biosynthesis protein, partial [Candidatus Micrarchaeota archaeon]|nr:teichoic acid biosynthesis protein [Candidatus Micrarchaeota archaeon]